MYYERGKTHMALSIRLNKEDSDLIREYAKVKNMSISELVRSAVIEKIEDEIDLAAYNRAVSAYHANPVTYTLDEVEKELGL